MDGSALAGGGIRVFGVPSHNKNPCEIKTIVSGCVVSPRRPDR